MADFQQRGIITTLHRLQPNRLDALEGELQRYSRSHGVTLTLPALYSEFGRPAMKRICDELRGVRFLDRIVVAVGQASREQVREAWRFFQGFATPVTLLWVEDPCVRQVFRKLENSGLPPGYDGKGRTCWLMFGYVLARRESAAVAVHDCDIIGYSRDLVARLCYPIAHPSLGFDFCKGYYARTAGQLYGRVSRLFVAPLLSALRELTPSSRLVSFLEEFRYPLAGEFSAKTQLLSRIRLPAHWGLEVGLLAEVLRAACADRICQSDLTDNYEHKHREISANDPSRGLRRMTRDIADTLLREIHMEQGERTGLSLDRLPELYRRTAEEMMARYAADAAINGLAYRRDAEILAVDSFEASLREALRPADGGAACTLLPSWYEVGSALPGLADEVLECGQDQPGPVKVFMRAKRDGAFGYMAQPTL